MNKTEETVCKIISDIMKVPLESVHSHSQKKDFELWDSLNQLNLVMEIESTFGITLSLEELSQLDSVDYIVNVVNHHLRQE